MIVVILEVKRNKGFLIPLSSEVKDISGFNLVSELIRRGQHNSQKSIYDLESVGQTYFLLTGEKKWVYFFNTEHENLENLYLWSSIDPIIQEQSCRMKHKKQRRINLNNLLK